MQTSNNPKEIQYILFQGHHRSRLVALINGIPFYQSSGMNSHQPRTWMPFKGIDVKTGWLIKPSKEENRELPEALLYYIKQLNITDDIISITRFGTLYTMCISANIGTGFWETEKGALLKTYLKTNCPDFFKDDRVISDLKQLNLDLLDANRQRINHYQVISKP